MSRGPKIKTKRSYRRDLKSHRFGFLLYDREDGFHPSVLGYDSEEEAEEELLKWNRVTGRDNHPVYAVCVVPMYKMGKLPPRVARRAFEKMLAKLQADRLMLAAALDRAEKLAGH